MLCFVVVEVGWFDDFDLCVEGVEVFYCVVVGVVVYY